MSTPTANRSATRSANDAYADVVVATLRRRLRDVASATDASLQDILGHPDVLAARVAAVVPGPSRLAATIGPVYRQASLAVAWGHSRQAVSDLVRRRRLLALTTKDGHVVLPSFQFDSDLRPLLGLVEILQILSPDVIDEWTLASWLTASQDLLDGNSVIVHLATCDEPARALALAESAARRWSA